MSDTDSESAFESADEGDEEFNGEAAALEVENKQSLSDDNNIAIQKVDQCQVEFEQNSNEPKESAAAAAAALQGDETNASECAGVSGAEGGRLEEQAQVSSRDLQFNDGIQVDEGLGDWDAGWEVDEDVLVDSDLSFGGVSGLTLSDPHETTHELKGIPVKPSEEKAQMNESSRIMEPTQLDTHLKEAESLESQQSSQQPQVCIS